MGDRHYFSPLSNSDSLEGGGNNDVPGSGSWIFGTIGHRTDVKEVRRGVNWSFFVACESLLWLFHRPPKNRCQVNGRRGAVLQKSRL